MPIHEAARKVWKVKSLQERNRHKSSLDHMEKYRVAQ